MLSVQNSSQILSQTRSQSAVVPNPPETIKPASTSTSHSKPTTNPSVPPESISTPGWKTYHNKNFGFEMRYPSTWRIVKTTDDEFWIANMQTSITMSVLDFRAPPPGKFQDWVNERPDALTKFRDRDALRWYTRGVPTLKHVHLLVSYPPNISINKLVQFIKGTSSRKLQQEFPQLGKRYWGQHLWARGFFVVSTGNVTTEMIQNYIKNHKDDDEEFTISRA